jgi:O-antigen ligase
MTLDNGIKQERFDKVNYFLILVIAITLPFGFLFKINSLFSILLVVAWLFQFKLSLKSALIRIFISFYILHVIGACYSSNLDQALFELEKKIGFLLFPLVLSAIPTIKKKYFINILAGFVTSCFVATLTCLSYATYHYLSTGSYDHFFYFPLAEIVRMHPIYLAMYTCFAIFIVVHLYFKETFWQSQYKKLVFAGVIGYFFLILFLLSARSVIMAFGIISVVAIIVYSFQKKQLLIGLGTIAALFIIASSLVYFIPTNLERFKEAINYKSQYSIDKQWGGRSLRLLKWDCSIDIIKQNMLFGVGTGDAQDELQKCYEQKNYTPLLFWENVKFNAHNQYLQTAIDLGLIGLILFLACIIVPLLNAIRHQNYLFISFVTLFALCCITESMLELNKGIIFFTFFTSLFTYHSKA